MQSDTPGRAVTLVGPEDEPMAAILHDAGLIEQRALLEAAGSAASLAFQNAQLQAELRAQLAELRPRGHGSSRPAMPNASAWSATCTTARSSGCWRPGSRCSYWPRTGATRELLAEARDELQAALRELRELARGIHPAILSDGGLPAAVRSLADRAPLPITVEVADGRYPEAGRDRRLLRGLRGARQHRQARGRALGQASPSPATTAELVVEVRDDGRGGADHTPGSGLSGLADRVGALSGSLASSARPALGTTVRAEIPCAS